MVTNQNLCHVRIDTRPARSSMKKEPRDDR